MTVHYDVPGINRKKLAQTIGKWFNVSVKYLGAPSFAYEIGLCKLDLNGNLTFDVRLDSPVVEALLKYLNREGFESSFSDVESIKNEHTDANKLTVALPKNSFTDEALENLKRLIESKNELIKKALNVKELCIKVSDETVSFPWEFDVTDPDTVKSYTHFISALCEMARNQKRIIAKEKVPENEKYAFRCFLLRLGFIGDKFKTERKILLKNLKGSSAFKGGIKNEISG